MKRPPIPHLTINYADKPIISLKNPLILCDGRWRAYLAGFKNKEEAERKDKLMHELRVVCYNTGDHTLIGSLRKEK